MVQVRFCGDMEIQRKLFGDQVGTRDNILLSFPSPASASKRLRVLMNAPQPFQDNAHVKDMGLRNILQRAD